jgi:hypothetical protein
VPRLTKSNKRRVFGVGVIALLITLGLSCPRDVSVEKEMFWTCLERGSRRAPDEPTLELRFIEAPAHIKYISGPTAVEICTELSKNRQNTVRVIFDVWGNSWNPHYWVRPLSIAGKPFTRLEDFLGGAHQGPDTTPDPLAGAFEIFK